MPREQKKRGRRAARKRERDEYDDAPTSTSPKRRRTERKSHGPAEDFIPLADEDGTADFEDAEPPTGHEKRYYGMLDEQEHEYFRNADSMLEVNQFADINERALFIENLHKEAAGKELKLACSQSGSRLLERLISLSNPDQLKSLFSTFHGEWIHLMSQRFASHCCEALLSRSAPIVSDELAQTPVNSAATAHDTPSMESLFLGLAKEIEGDLGYMMTDRYASHCLRVLILCLAGRPADQSSQRSIDKSQHKSLVFGKRKENIGAQTNDVPKAGANSISVPESFPGCLQQITTQSIAGLDTAALRSFATHKIANPTLQLLLQIELTLFGKQRGAEEGSMLKKLLPDESITEGTDSAAFINGMFFDPVGSHLLETIVQYAPGKTFKALYKDQIKPRIAELVRHETASYVLCQVLERLGGKELSEAVDAIIPEVPKMAERGRFNIFRTVAERLIARDVDSKVFAKALKEAYACEGNDGLSLSKLLQLPDKFPEVPISPKPEAQLHLVTTPAQNAASVFTQALLRLRGPLSAMVFEALGNLEFKSVRCIAHTSPLSPILQTALTADTASIIFRRKLITHLYGAICEFSVSASASHVVDSVEKGTRRDLAFVRERIAEELSESESALRQSPCGRKVWRNWDMDLYQRNRERWIKDTRKKVGNNGFQSFPGLLGEADVAAKEKGKDPLGRIKATIAETMGAAEEIGKNTHQTVHEQICEPIRVTGKTALDRARARYAQKQQGGHGSAPATRSQ